MTKQRDAETRNIIRRMLAGAEKDSDGARLVELVQRGAPLQIGKKAVNLATLQAEVAKRNATRKPRGGGAEASS